MAINFKKSAQRIEASAIKEIECRLMQTLPDDYRQFLLTTNGGIPENNVFAVAQTRTHCGVRRFYGITGEKADGDLLSEQRLLGGRLPDGIIAIAEAEGGNRVCLSLRDDDRGAIFFWDHELEAEDNTSAALAILSSSFDVFLMSLQPFDPRNIQLKPGQIKKIWINPDFLKNIKGGDG